MPAATDGENEGGPKQPRAALHLKTDAQISILNQWWKARTRKGTIDKTLCTPAEKQKLADKTGLPMNVLDNWLGNTRKKARKIAREHGALPQGPIMKKNKKKPTKKAAKGRGRGKARSNRAPMVTKTEEQLFILNSWWEQKTRGGNIDATMVDAEEKQALAQATGLDLQVLEYWLGNTRKKARKQAAAGYI